MYLSEKLNGKGLPKNCLYDKGQVGCGGTTVAIEGKEPYVIAVPYTSLVKNKVGQYPNERYPHRVKEVYAGIQVPEIIDYLDIAEVPKIVCTYDGLDKVMDALGESVSKVNLLVDEYHILFTQYGFRSKAVNCVLQNYKKFKTYTFMSATPLEKAFVLLELKGLDIVTEKWAEEEKLEVTVVRCRCQNVLASAAKYIKAFLQGQFGDANAYFFVNSVEVIKTLVKMCRLDSSNCRTIYSQSRKVKIADIPNSTVDDAPKKINFLTSTAFEGCDLMDENGVTFILSDPSYQNSLVDIGTSVRQIAGRIRNSKYIGKMYHLFGANRYIQEKTPEEYDEQVIQPEIEVSNNIVAEYNSLSPEARHRMGDDLRSRYIVKNEDDTFTFDENLAKIDLFNYKVQNEYTSSVTLDKSYKDVGIVTKGSRDFARIEDLMYDDGVGIEDTHFTDVVKQLRELSENDKEQYDVILRDASIEYNWLPEAIEKLGFSKIASLGYVQKDIQLELERLEDIPNNKKICRALGFHPGEWASVASVKSKLQKAYDRYLTGRKATATQITQFYDAKRQRRRVNGVEVEGYLLNFPLYRW